MGSLDFQLPIINGTGNIHSPQKNEGVDSIKNRKYLRNPNHTQKLCRAREKEVLHVAELFWIKMINFSRYHFPLNQTQPNQTKPNQTKVLLPGMLKSENTQLAYCRVKGSKIPVAATFDI